ncbi:Ciliary neurotrophic factor receptor subunit alpha [Acipenser ruthenus]|uniref:Ciliary neurotrophic factor receptor subunit alpha n=1 Tax=Acipenser ruthenus TaxID=7906 RepID=A0A444UPI5_ACIRT|nr:Ciliary neurotrophic factor receptor subunit alpha [Acipenser ruthenus]
MHGMKKNSAEDIVTFHPCFCQVELSDSTSHTITDAYAGKEYIIQVAAKDTEIGTWSDWSVAIHATPWMEVPRQHITTTTEAGIAEPPKEPVVTCRSNTYPKGFYCTWHLPHPSYIPTEFEVSVKHGNKKLEFQKDPVHKNRCYVKYPELFSTNKYKVNVIAINALGNSSTYISFDEFSIVKPDPPEKLVANPVPNNVRRLEVTWNNPSTWPDAENFPLKYFLRYRPLILDQWQHVSTYLSMACGLMRVWGVRVSGVGYNIKAWESFISH